MLKKKKSGKKIQFPILYFKFNGRLRVATEDPLTPSLDGQFPLRRRKIYLLRVHVLREVASQTFLLLKCRTISYPTSLFLAIPAIVWRQIRRALSGI